MSIAEMRMLHWICSHTRKDRIRNDDIRDELRITPIQDKLIQHRLRWFGYIQRRPPEAPVRSGILSHPEKHKKRKISTETDMGESNKKRFEGMKCIQRACFG
jgi:hypothetical protein